jgi:stress response protein YsnF
VVVRKEIETEIIEVPIQREKLIIEQVGDEPRTLAEIDLDDPVNPNI